MRKFLLFFILSGLSLAACGSPTPLPTPVSTPTSAAPVAQPTPRNVCIDVRLPTPDPSSEVSLFPPVSEQDHTRGLPTAPVTFLMYSDFQCPDCAKIAVALEAARQKQPNNLRIIYRHYPQVANFDKALLTAQASEAAALQGKFWELHDLLFSRQTEWTTLTPEAFKPWLAGQIVTLGLDTARYEADLNSEAVKNAITAAIQSSQKYGNVPLPLLIINGEIIRNPYILVNLESLVRLYALPARQFSSCPPFSVDPAKTYTATLKTTKGEIVVNLFADKTPNTVNNFIFLARQGWYDNVPFHKVVPGSLAQTGDPTGTGMGNPGYFIPNEIDPTLKFDRAGMLAMFNVAPDTNGSQFFITLGALPDLDKNYTIFGEVSSGMEVLANLTPHDPAAQSEPDLLLTVVIEEK
jgi:cyclophilin family peptidyl-prolyl cis-trans isomerase/protein-disulfide isomerase